MDRHPVLRCAAVGLLLALVPVMALAQWEPTGRLGLSASSTTYIDTVEPTVGEPFILHVILTGMAADEPLAFELASVTFDWLLEGEEEFLLSAGSLTGALDCEDEGHLLQTLTVLVMGQDPSPVESATLSGIKALFGAGEDSP